MFAALKSGSIDLYPEYTGTIARRSSSSTATRPWPRSTARSRRWASAPPCRSASTTATRSRCARSGAQALGIRTLSDLARSIPRLKLGLSQEFIGRADGWPGLKAAYGLPHATPSGLDHGLAYEAIAAGQIDVMDIYTTDAKIERYGLRVLEDDRKFFPRYDAVLLYRLDVPKRFPRAWARCRSSKGASTSAA